MSMTDYRKMIDLRGGSFIGVEVTDGRTVEVSINGDAIRIDLDQVHATTSVIRQHMNRMMGDGMNASFQFGWAGVRVELNYYDAGQVLDAILGAVRFLA